MNINEILQQSPIMPVIVIDKLEYAVPLAQALVDGGLPVLEVTLRSEIAMQAVHDIARAVSGATVGVGTVTRPDQFRTALEAGARFTVSPGLTDDLVTASRAAGLPFLPGVFSPSEIMCAQELGFDAFKLFPAQQAGGIDMLRALSGPLPEARFCPTGGINNDNFIEYLKLPNVTCVGGSWVCPTNLVEDEDWNQVTHLAAGALAMIEQNR